MLPLSRAARIVLLSAFCGLSIGAKALPAKDPAPAQPPRDAKPAWQTFAPAGAGFRIEVRGKPQDHSAYVDLPTTKVYTRLYAVNDAARKRSVAVSVNRLSQAPQEAAVAAVFDSARGGILAAVQGELLDEQETTLGEYQGRTWLMKASGGNYLHLRVFAADARMYQVCLESPERALTADDRRILDSFRILAGATLVDPPRKYDWRWVTPEGESFAVQLPDDPQESTLRRATAVGEVDVRVLTWGSADAEPRYEAAAYKLPQAATAEQAEQLLNEARSRALAAAGSQAARDEKWELAGRQGRKLSVVTGDRTRYLRFIVAGDRFYELSAAGKPPEPTEDDERFLNSLKLPSK